MRDDDEVGAVLRRAGDQIEVGPAPVPLLLEKGHRARRRRSVVVVGGCVAATLAVTGGVAVAVGLASRQPNTDASAHHSVDPVTPARPTPTGSGPAGVTVPPGTRLVAFDGIGVAVPAAWSTNDAACQNAFADTVVIGENPGIDCGFYVPSGVVSSAHLVPRRVLDRRGDVLGEVAARGAVAGNPYVRYRTHAIACNGAQCHEFAGAVRFDDRDVAIWVESPSRQTIDAILGSVFILPRGYGAVPINATPHLLTRLGFAVREQVQYRPRLIPGWLLRTSPEVGSIVPTGSSVTLTLSTRVAGDPCAGLQVELITPEVRRAVSAVARQSFTVRVRAGESVSVQSTGACAGTVQASSAGASVLSMAGPWTFTALEPGTARLDVGMPMCAGAPPSANCRGGFFSFAEVTVVVEP